VVVQLDAGVGEIMEALDRLGLDENTLVLFTSDNGPVLDDGYRDQAVELQGDHDPMGPYRGGKYSAFEAGTRVPFIVWWPERVRPGVSDALVSQIDLMSSFAGLLGIQLTDGDAPDSFDELPVLFGESTAGREYLVEHNSAGTLSLIRGSWKYIEPSDAAAYNAYTDIELGNDSQPQLYDLESDEGEMRNVAAENPEVMKELAGQLQRLRDEGRSRQ
jgi:arylsulfatase A-like enzyme